MQTVPFYKYQGAGNDFVLLDQRQTQYLNRDEQDKIAFLCDRRFGVGADGLMLLQHKEGYDFEMIYFNADGREGSMCGNGGRCIVAFAQHLGLIGEECTFWAVDGPHTARLPKEDWVELQMGNVTTVERGASYYFMDTGSPHYVQFIPKLKEVDVAGEGRAIRYNDRFREKGTNVNFVEATPDRLHIGTYERGVEDETLACGTGVTAAALAWFLETEGKSGHNIEVKAKGGDLQVRFEPNGPESFEAIWLCGPAKKVFTGEILM